MVSVTASWVLFAHFWVGGKSTGWMALWNAIQTAMRSSPMEEDAWYCPIDKQWFLPGIHLSHLRTWSVIVLWVWMFTWSALQTQISTLQLNTWCLYFNKMLDFTMICLCFGHVSVKISHFQLHSHLYTGLHWVMNGHTQKLLFEHWQMLQLATVSGGLDDRNLCNNYFIITNRLTEFFTQIRSC